MTNEIRMTAPLCKFLMLLGCVTLALLTAEARIVYTPMEALSNPGGMNPYTDANGGVWSVSRRMHGNDAVSAGALLPKHFTYVEGLVGFSPDTEDSYTVPLACVNVTDREIALTSGNCRIGPGELYLHPGSPTVSDSSRIVVAFKVPRDGWYSLSARFRAIDLQSSGYVDTTIVADGAILFQEEIFPVQGEVRWGTPFSFSHRFLRKGAELAFALGSGWTKTGYERDSTALSVEIVEEEASGEAVGTADLGQALNVLTVDAAGEAAVFPDPSGLGTWTLGSSRDGQFVIGYDALEYTGASTFGAVSPQDLGESGVVFCPSGASLPLAQTYGKDTAGSSGKYGTHSRVRTAGDNIPYDMMTPGEAILHPDKSGASACVFAKFVPAAAGCYLVSLDARDISKRTMSADDADGVDVAMFVGGENQVERRVCAESGQTWYTWQSRVLFLPAGEPVVLRVDPRGSNDSDGLGVFFRITKLPDSSGNMWDASRAVCEGVAAALAGGPSPANPQDFNPFVSQGATWKLGSAATPGADGDFGLLTKWSSYGALQGWEAAEGIPLVCGNTQSEPFGNAQSTLVAKNQWLYPGEFAIHPNTARYGVVRFVVPADGVYDVTAVCRDMNGNGTDFGAGNGVICHVVAGERYAASAVANARANPEITRAYLMAERLYLKRDAVIDLCVAPNRTSKTDSDSTAVRERIFAAPSLKVLSVDFVTPGSAPFAGRGRVGFSESAWQSLVVGEGVGSAEANGCKDDAANATRVSVTLAAADGGTLVVPSEGAGLFAGGIAAANETTVFTWRVSGLIPQTSYRFYLYGTGGAIFAAGGTESALTGQWFAPKAAEYAVLEAVADENGVVLGSFCGSAEAAGTFSALQIEGPAFKDPPRGMIVIFR